MQRLIMRQMLQIPLRTLAIFPHRSERICAMLVIDAGFYSPHAILLAGQRRYFRTMYCHENNRQRFIISPRKLASLPRLRLLDIYHR